MSMIGHRIKVVAARGANLASWSWASPSFSQTLGRNVRPHKHIFVGLFYDFCSSHQGVQSGNNTVMCFSGKAVAERTNSNSTYSLITCLVVLSCSFPLSSFWVKIPSSTFHFWKPPSPPAPCNVGPSRTKWVPWSCNFSARLKISFDPKKGAELQSHHVPSVISAEVLPLVCHLVLQMPILLVHAWCYPPQWQASPRPDPNRGGGCWSKHEAA